MLASLHSSASIAESHHWIRWLKRTAHLYFPLSGSSILQLERALHSGGRRQGKEGRKRRKEVVGRKQGAKNKRQCEQEIKEAGGRKKEGIQRGKEEKRKGNQMEEEQKGEEKERC